MKFSALHCLLILCMAILPVAGSAAGDAPHHAGGDCHGCDFASFVDPLSCGDEPCAATASSCGSHHGPSMMFVGFASPDSERSTGAAIARHRDDFGPPPPGRIDRPPIT